MNKLVLFLITEFLTELVLFIMTVLLSKWTGSFFFFCVFFFLLILAFFVVDCQADLDVDNVQRRELVNFYGV